MRPEDAALTIARRFGVAAVEPVMLSDSNNVVVWLQPSLVVAKVATGHHRQPSVELSVARHLVSCGVPVVPPADQLPQEVHRAGGFEVTFWQYQRPSGREPDARELASALFELHQGLLSYSGALPSYREELSAVKAVLGDAARVPALAANDRALLLAALARFGAELARHPVAERPLHGAPHGANTIVTCAGVRFIDLETACVGPLEWDLSYLDPQGAQAYPARFDPARLQLCRVLASVKTAARCWARFEHPALKWHATHHLAVVRGVMAGRLRGGPAALPVVAGRVSRARSGTDPVAHHHGQRHRRVGRYLPGQLTLGQGQVVEDLRVLQGPVSRLRRICRGREDGREDGSATAPGYSEPNCLKFLCPRPSDPASAPKVPYEPERFGRVPVQIGDRG